MIYLYYYADFSLHAMRTIRTLTILLFAQFILISSFVAGAANAANDGTATEKRAYRFAVFPYMSPMRLHDIYAPIVDELEVQLGEPIRFRTSSTFERFLQAMKQGEFDFALIQPFWYPVAVDEHAYRPLIRMQEPFVSLILVLEDSDIRSVQDLRGHVVATPPIFVPVVFMATQSLIDSNLIPGRDLTLKAFKNIESCFQQVLIGEAKACVSPPFAPGIYEQSMGVKFRTVLTSPSIPNLALVAHSKVPESHQQTVKDTILSWQRNALGRSFLSSMQTEAFVPINDAEYDIVRDYVGQVE